MAWDEDHRLALAQHDVVLGRVSGSAEDVDSDGVRKAFLERARAVPQWLQIASSQSGLLEQFATRGRLGRLAGLDTPAGQAPLVRGDGRMSVSMLQQDRTRTVDEEDERDFIRGHRQIMPSHRGHSQGPASMTYASDACARDNRLRPTTGRVPSISTSWLLRTCSDPDTDCACRSAVARIRVARNTGSREPLATAVDLRTTDQEVFHDPEHASTLLPPYLPDRSAR